MMPETNAHPITLDAVLNSIWDRLLHGAEKASDPFHCPALGTSSPTGCSLRTVVLRRVLVDDRILLCHTDRRSSKVVDINKSPKVGWLFYHPEAKVQLRIDGTATVHIHDELADQQWAASKLISRRCYCAPDPPGTPVDHPDSGLPETLVNRTPTAAESEIGRAHFAVIACRVMEMDWLYLKAGGHLHAHFSWEDDSWHGTWLTP